MEQESQGDLTEFGPMPVIFHKRKMLQLCHNVLKTMQIKRCLTFCVVSSRSWFISVKHKFDVLLTEEKNMLTSNGILVHVRT